MLSQLKVILSVLIMWVACVAGAANQPGFSASLPQINQEQCAIACYTNLNNEYAVAGYYATDGKYTGRVCRPGGFMGDISPKNSTYSQKCSVEVEYCKTNICWAGGDTGGFYGKGNDSALTNTDQSYIALIREFGKIATAYESLATKFAESIKALNTSVAMNNDSMQQLATNQVELLDKVNCAIKIIIGLLVIILICCLICVVMLWQMKKRTIQEAIKSPATAPDNY